MATSIKSNVGRMVWGHPGKPTIKKIQDGPDAGKPVLRDGQPVNVFGCGIAFPKAEFQRDIWPGLSREASAGFPNGVPANFAWKYIDGDGVDSKGNRYSDREGYAGCYILSITTEAFAPPVYKWTGTQYVQLKPEEYKCGDYFTVDINAVVNVQNDPRKRSSLYINPQGFLWVAYGNEILRTADPTQMFGAAPPQYQLPPGASLQPMAPQTGVGMPGSAPPPGPGQMPGAPQPGQYQQPQPGYNPPPGPITSGHAPGQMPNYQPAPDFVHNAGHQQPGLMPGAPQQPQYGQQMPPQPGQYQQPQYGQQMPPGMTMPPR